jgi:outer membrane protein assembly factor BamB
VVVVAACETNQHTRVHSATEPVTMRGLDGVTGKLRWSTPVAADEQLIDTGTVLVLVPDQGDPNTGQTGTATATALDWRTGRQRWRGPVPDFGGSQFVGSADALFGFFNASSAPMGGVPSPSAYSLVATDARSGQPRWQVPLGGVSAAAPIVVGSVVTALFVVSSPSATSPSSALVGFDTATGRELWRHSLPGDFPGGAIASGNGAIYVLTPNGLTAFTAQSGATQWTVPLTGPARGPASTITAGAGIVALSTPHGVVMLDAHDGHRRWETSQPAPLAIAEHNIYLTATAGSCGGREGGGD